jgi:putative transposase
MAKKPRVVVVGAPHHLYLLGNNRRRLFSDDDDHLLWVRCLQAGLEESQCAMHQLTLMTSHVQMIVTPPEPKALAKLVKRTCERFAQHRNARYEGSGKLFQERYQSIVITDDEQLMFTTLYNDANAFRARLVRDPVAHAWSTGPLHAGGCTSRIPRRLWTPSPWYRGLGGTARARAATYRQLMVAYTRRDAEVVIAREELDMAPYRRRIQRPDGSSAREPSTQWGRKS